MKRVVWTALFCWIGMSALCCVFYPCLMSDTMARYAPMADAFARGDWSDAFHPRFGVIFPAGVGSLVKLTGIRGDIACQIVSLFFFTFSIVPVWALVKHAFGSERVAWVAAVLTLLAPECFVFAIDGLREPCRTFGFALCLLAFVAQRPTILAIGLFALVTLRTDLFFISGAILFAWYVLHLRERRTLPLVWPTFGFLIGAAAVTGMTWAYTGYFLPGAQFIGIYLKLTGGAA